LAIGVRSRVKTFRNIDSVIKSAKRLKSLLNNEDIWTIIAPHLIQLEADKNRGFSRDSLDVLLDATARALHPKRSFKDDKAENKVTEIVQELTKQSIFDTLVGALENVFVTHFGLPASIHRPKHEDDDALFIRFVRSVLPELKVSGMYTDEAIIRARSTARSALGRRKAA
jgi:hypothetical protein